MLTDTIRTFGYPATLLCEYEHWVVLLRRQQVTAGSMVLAAKHGAERLPELPPEAFSEMRRASADLEQALRETFAFEKINYLLLMMVDRQVHFHVIPRYAGPRDAVGIAFEDRGWPRAPSLGEFVELTDEQVTQLGDILRAAWPVGT
jgi:diadenosine tetraphosphate (Ap4A) HIT family hydrolase